MWLLEIDLVINRVCQSFDLNTGKATDKKPTPKKPQKAGNFRYGRMFTSYCVDLCTLFVFKPTSRYLDLLRLVHMIIVLMDYFNRLIYLHLSAFVYAYQVNVYAYLTLAATLCGIGIVVCNPNMCFTLPNVFPTCAPLQARALEITVTSQKSFKSELTNIFFTFSTLLVIKCDVSHSKAFKNVAASAVFKIITYHNIERKRSDVLVGVFLL